MTENVHYSKFPQATIDKAVKLIKKGEEPKKIAKGTKVSLRTLANWKAWINAGEPISSSINTSVKRDIQTYAKETAEKRLKKKYKDLLEKNQNLEAENKALLDLRNVHVTTTIESKSPKESEATAIILASDWHVEERVEPDDVSGMNRFNLSIAEERIKNFFINSLNLYNMARRDVKIHNIAFGLLGDFISGNINEELLEICDLQPIDAAIKAQGHLIDGINFYLSNTDPDVQITIICKPGNHSRITKRVRGATFAGNSLEYMVYCTIALIFQDNPRIKIILDRGYHTYIPIYNTLTRWHHGHAIRYLGGIGGLHIPVKRGIAQWNRGRNAGLDLFAHFHQQKDDGNFICNGSLIGYNAYAVKIKAEYERPQQTFLLLDKNRGKTIVAPILLDSN